MPCSAGTSGNTAADLQEWVHRDVKSQPASGLVSVIPKPQSCAAKGKQTRLT